jgi:hypothetical protein
MQRDRLREKRGQKAKSSHVSLKEGGGGSRGRAKKKKEGTERERQKMVREETALFSKKTEG